MNLQIIRITCLEVPLVLACTEMATKIRPIKGTGPQPKLKHRGGKTREGNPPVLTAKGTQGQCTHCMTDGSFKKGSWLLRFEKGELRRRVRHGVNVRRFHWGIAFWPGW